MVHRIEHVKCSAVPDFGITTMNLYDEHQKANNANKEPKS